MKTSIQSIPKTSSIAITNPMAEQAKRDRMMLSSLVEQLTLEAQVLVQYFVELVKQQEHHHALKPQWSSVEILCLSIESAISGFGAANNPVQTYVNEISKIVALVSEENTAHSIIKDYQTSFPYYILKLLSAIKSTIKTYIDDIAGSEMRDSSDIDIVVVTEPVSKMIKYNNIPSPIIPVSCMMLLTLQQEDMPTLPRGVRSIKRGTSVRQAKQFFEVKAESLRIENVVTKPLRKATNNTGSNSALARPMNTEYRKARPTTALDSLGSLDGLAESPEEVKPDRSDVAVIKSSSNDSIKTICKPKNEDESNRTSPGGVIAINTSPVINGQLQPSVIATSAFPELPVLSTYYRQMTKKTDAKKIQGDEYQSQHALDKTTEAVTLEKYKKQLSSDNLHDRLHGGITTDQWKGSRKSILNGNGPALNSVMTGPMLYSRMSFPLENNGGDSKDILVQENVKSLITMPLANILGVASILGLESSLDRTAKEAPDIGQDKEAVIASENLIKYPEEGSRSKIRTEDAENVMRKISLELAKIIKPEKSIPCGTEDYNNPNTPSGIKASSAKSTPASSKSVDKMVSPFVSPSAGVLAQFNLANLPLLDDSYTQLILIPLNGMFELCYLNLSKSNLLGRSNTTKYSRFKAFPTQVVSRSHLEIWESDSEVFIKDVGSSSGSFLNGVRLSDPSIQSSAFEVQSGDIVQLGKDYVDPKTRAQNPMVVNVQHRCIKMQLVIVFKKEMRAPSKSIIGKVVSPMIANSFPSLQILETPIATQDPSSMQIIGDERLQMHKKDDFSLSKSTPPGGLMINTFTAKADTMPRLNIMTESRVNSPMGTERNLRGKSKIATTIPNDLEKFNYERELEEKMRIERQILEQQEKFEQGVMKQQAQRITKVMPPHAQPAKRERFMMNSTGTMAKIRKLHVTSENGVPVLNVNLKGWDIRKHLMMEDMRPKFSKTRNLDLVQTDPEGGLFTLYVAGGPVLGTMAIINDMKLQITPAAHLALLYQSTPRTSALDVHRSSSNSLTSIAPAPLLYEGIRGLSSSTHSSQDSSLSTASSGTVTFCVTGDLREGSWIIIMKFTTSRQQRLIGESRGRTIARKNVRESKWTFMFDFEESVYSQLLLAAVCYLTLS